jgi:hypothetical protein
MKEVRWAFAKNTRTFTPTVQAAGTLVARMWTRMPSEGVGEAWRPAAVRPAGRKMVTVGAGLAGGANGSFPGGYGVRVGCGRGSTKLPKLTC